MQRAMHCDYLVIGGGSAGCVVAGRLAEDRQARVVLLEAGVPDSHFLLPVPGAMPVTGTSPKFNWRCVTEPEPDAAGRRFFLAQGKVLGGGSSINGMVYTRGQPGDYDGWRDSGCVGWGYEDVLPYFRKSESHALGPNPWHGGDGPLQVMRGHSRLPICDAFLEAMGDAGYARVEDHSAGPQEGFGYYDWTVARGRRSSSTVFLEDARNRNLEVITGALATRLILENGRAGGCEYLHRGERRTVVAERAVVVCAGAIRSPHLLMLSGIGPADALRALNVAVAVDAPDVGRNLQNHLSYKLEYACDEPVTAYKYLSPWRALGSGLEYVLFGSGILGGGSSPLGGFFRSDSGLPYPDFQAFLSPALIGRMDRGARRVLPTAHGFGVHVNQGAPRSRGEIRLASADPLQPPRIIGRYFSDADDVAALTRAAKMIREALHGKALAPYIARELQPSGELTNDREWAHEIRNNAGNFFHVAGSCRMGEDATAVVDSTLRVRGVERLYVADASIMPRLVNGQTNAPAIMIGEKAAALISGAPLPSFERISSAP